MTAFFLAETAPSGKAAARGWIDGTWDITFQHDPVHMIINRWDWNCTQQSLGIRMGWMLKKILAFSFFNNLSQIHNSDFITDMFYNA